MNRKIRKKRRTETQADQQMKTTLKVVLVCLAIVGLTAGWYFVGSEAVSNAWSQWRQTAQVKKEADEEERLEEESEEVLSGYGNTFQNISEGGCFLVSGDYIYYADPADDERLYRMKQDGTENELLVDSRCGHLNLYDGCLFFDDYEKDNHLYKYNLDTEKLTLLLDERVYEPKVVDGWIYYSLVEDGYSLWRMDLDGQNNSKITEGIVFYCCITDEKAYFIHTYDDYKAYYVNLDGSERTVWMEEACNALDYRDGVLYYSLKAGGIYAFSVDDPDDVWQVSDLKTSSFNVYDGWIYFSNREEDKNHALYKMDLNGENVTQLCGDATAMINVSGDWIYCQYEDESTWTWYRIKTDGSQKEDLN